MEGLFIPLVELKELPANAKALLSTGALEGLQVRYMDKSMRLMAVGTVKDGAIMCECKDCKGKQVKGKRGRRG